MKKTFRTRTAKAISAVLVAAFTFTLIPMALGQNAVEAATAITKDQSNTSLGVSGIKDPTSGGDTNSDWAGCYVYFGNYNGPIKFRVLTKDSPHTSSAALLLDSDAILETMAFGSTNDWSNSSVKTWLKDDFFTSTNFTKIEMAAVPATKNEDPHVLTTATVSNWSVGAYGSYVPLSGEQVFLLDAEEASNSSYGYSITDDPCVSRQKTGGNDCWWLRSAGSSRSSYAGGVYYDGLLSLYDLDDDYVGVAPALNISQESIIFTTAAGNEANAYKLTLSDSNLNIAVPAGQYVTASGTTITVPYEISGDDAGTATRASILITDKAWNESDAKIILYDELGASTASSGTFTLPSGYDLDGWGKDYHVYILAEDINDVKETDYASEPVEIWQTYTVTYTISNGTWSDGSTADITETVIKGSSPSTIPTGMIASSGYEGGSWDTDPSKASISADTTFTYTFDVVPTYTVTVQNDGNGKASVDVTSGAKGTEVTLTATPDSGYQFKEWQVVSGGVTVTDNKFTIGTSDVTVKAVFEAELTVPAANTYSVIKGADGIWDGKSDYVVEVKRSTDDEHCIDRFMWAAVDGHELKVGEECELAVGSTIVIIKSDYLKTLGAGTHNIVVNFTDNSVATKLTINAASTSAGASVPSTGEIISPAFWIGSSSVAAGMLFAIVLIQKKRKSAQR